jgi:hypothetical protein
MVNCIAARLACSLFGRQAPVKRCQARICRSAFREQRAEQFLVLHFREADASQNFSSNRSHRNERGKRPATIELDQLNP